MWSLVKLLAIFKTRCLVFKQSEYLYICILGLLCCCHISLWLFPAPSTKFLCHCSLLAARTGHSLVSSTGKKAVLYSYILSKKRCTLLCQRNHVLFPTFNIFFFFLLQLNPSQKRSYKLCLAIFLKYIFFQSLKRDLIYIETIHTHSRLEGVNMLLSIKAIFSLIPMLLQLVYINIFHSKALTKYINIISPSKKNFYLYVQALEARENILFIPVVYGKESSSEYLFVLWCCSVKTGQESSHQYFIYYYY